MREDTHPDAVPSSRYERSEPEIPDCLRPHSSFRADPPTRSSNAQERHASPDRARSAKRAREP